MQKQKERKVYHGCMYTILVSNYYTDYHVYLKHLYQTQVPRENWVLYYSRDRTSKQVYDIIGKLAHKAVQKHIKHL